MDREFAFGTISRDTFDALLGQYKDVLPEKLLELDEQRYSTIPATLLKRRGAGDAYLTKAEAFALMTWKLSHGKFRPTLKALLQQNSEEAVEAATRKGFSLYDPDVPESIKPSIEALSQLRGIGPATASLLLSVHAPKTAPFFSVGIFGWAMDRKGYGKEWEAGVKYNLKEYLEIYDRVSNFCKRLGVEAVDVEKAGYVLGHTGKGASTGASKEAESAGRKRKSDAVNEEVDEKEGTKATKATTRSSKRKK